MKKDVVLLYGYINDDLAERVCDKLIGFDRMNTQEPIYLYINSRGGDVGPAMSIYNTISRLERSVYTVPVGDCCSMAFIILLAGAKRFAGKCALIMYHQIGKLFEAQIEKHRRDLEVSYRLDGQLKEIIVTNTEIPLEKLKEYDNTIDDWYFTDEELFKYKIIDGYM